MTAPSRARTAEPISYGPNAPAGRSYVDDLPPCDLLTELYGDTKAGVFEAPSVTTVIKGGSPTSWALRNWDRESTASYAVREARVWSQLKLPNGDLDEAAAIELIKGAPDRTLGRASGRGTDVHAVMEAMAKYGQVPDIGEERAGWVRGLRRFWLDHAPVPVWVEVSVYSRRPGLKYAGTLDLIVWLRNADTGLWELWLVDLKTGKGVYGDMALQQAAYRYADYGIVGDTSEGPWRRERLPKVQRTGILNVREDGSYDLVELETATTALEDFAACQDRWERQKNERTYILGKVPIPGRLEVELASSLLVERAKALPPVGREMLGRIWPAEVPTEPKTWTATHVTEVDRVLSAVEAELALPLEPTPSLVPAELPPTVDAFAGLPVAGEPDPMTEAATAARGGRPGSVEATLAKLQEQVHATRAERLAELPEGAEGRTPQPEVDPEESAALEEAAEEAEAEGETIADELARKESDELLPPLAEEPPVSPEARDNARLWASLDTKGRADLQVFLGQRAPTWPEVLEGLEHVEVFKAAHGGRTPAQEEHFQGQLLRLQSPPAETPAPALSEAGLTEREAELWTGRRDTLLGSLADLPEDLQRDMDGWAAAKGIPNARTMKPSRETLRQLDLAMTALGDRRRAHDGRVERATRLVEAVIPWEEPGNPDLWALLAHIACTGDDTEDTMESGAAPWNTSAMTMTQLRVVTALAEGLGALRIFLRAGDDGRICIGVNEKLTGEALATLGLNATQLKGRAKELAMATGMPHRPRKAEEVRASAILSSLLLSSPQE